jgi:hypothetical protein
MAKKTKGTIATNEEELRLHQGTLDEFRATMDTGRS